MYSGNKTFHNDQSILNSLKHGEEKCLRMIFDNYYRALCVYALKYLPSLDDAEDIVQNVLISFWEQWSQREFIGSIRSYLFSAVYKSSLNFLQRNGFTLFDDIEQHVNQFLDEVAEYSEEDMENIKRRLYEEVNDLPAKAKEVFDAIVLENLTYKEVAARYDISVNTVKSHYSYALKKLRLSLGDLLVFIFMV